MDNILSFQQVLYHFPKSDSPLYWTLDLISVQGFQWAISLHKAIKTRKTAEIYKTKSIHEQYISNFFQRYVSLKSASWFKKNETENLKVWLNLYYIQL